MESHPGTGSTENEKEDADVGNEYNAELKSSNTGSKSDDRDVVKPKTIYRSIFDSDCSADSETRSHNFLANLPKISFLKNSGVPKEEEFEVDTDFLIEEKSPEKETNFITAATEHLSPEERETFSKVAEDLDLLNSLGANHDDNGGKAIQLYMGPYGRIKSPFKKFSSFQNCSRSKRSPRKFTFPERQRLKFHHKSDSFTSDEEEEEEEEAGSDDGMEDPLKKTELPSTSGLNPGDTEQASTSRISPHSSEQTDDSSDEENWQIVEDSDNEFDEELNRKSNKFSLSAVNVKSIIHKIVTNESVVEMVRQAVKEHSQEDQCGFEPKMTRARVKEALETHGNVPWGLSPVKKPDSKFVDIDLPEEEEDDEEYCPDKTSPGSDTEDTESVVSSSFTSDIGSPLPSTPSTPSVTPASFVCKPCTPSQSQSDSENNQSFLSPMGPPSNISIPKSNQKSSSLGRKFRDAIEKDERREAEEKELIASRTRSKHPLTDQTLLDIEANLNFVAPDITLDLYDTKCDDNEWQDFLRGFYNSGVASVEDIVDTMAEEEDPEYNFLEELEELDEYDQEDFRDDRAVKVSKKELNELLDELYEEEYGMADPIDDTCKQSIKAQTETIINTKKYSSHCKSLLNGISDYERRQIDDQMRKHVQLLTQTFIMAQDGIEEHKKVADVARMYLNELKSFHQRFAAVCEESVYDVCNLPSALNILSDPVWSKPQEIPSIKVKDIVFRFDKQTVPPLSERQMNVLWYNPMFMYPELLPQGGFFVMSQLKKDRARIRFTEAEDNLLAMGLEQFGHLPIHKEYICRYMLPCKTKKQITGRIKNLSTKAARDNPVKMWRQSKCLPVFPQYATWFDPSIMMAACDQDVQLEKLPPWCVVYKKADDEKDTSPGVRQSASAPVTPQGQEETLRGNEMSASFPKVKETKIRNRKLMRRQLNLNGPYSRPNNGSLGTNPQNPLRVCVLNQITSTADGASYTVKQSSLGQSSPAAIPTTVSSTGVGPTVIIINNMPASDVCNNKPVSTASYGVNNNALSQPLQESVGYPPILSEAPIDNSLPTVSQNSLRCSSAPIQCEESLPAVPSGTSLSDILSTAAAACDILPNILSTAAAACNILPDSPEKQNVSVGTVTGAESENQPIQKMSDDNLMMSVQTNTVSNEASQEDKSIRNIVMADLTKTEQQQNSVTGRANCSSEQLARQDVKPVIGTVHSSAQTVASSTKDNAFYVKSANRLILPSTMNPNLPRSASLVVSQNSIGNQQPKASIITFSPIHANKAQTESSIVSGAVTPVENSQLTESQIATPPRVNIPEQGGSGYSTPTQLTPSSSASSQKSATKSALEIVASYAPYFVSPMSCVKICTAEQQRQERSPTKTMSKFIRLAPKGTPPSSEKPTGFIKVRSSPRKKQYQKQAKTILPKGFVISTFDRSPTKMVASSLVEKAKKGKHGLSRSHEKYCKILPRPANGSENLKITGATCKTSNHVNGNLFKGKHESSDTIKLSKNTVNKCKEDGDADLDLIEDDDEEDEDRDRDDDDDDKCFDTESDFTQSEDGNETQEEVDSQEDSQEDDDIHIADLMQASTTLRFDPGRDDPSKARLGKKDRDRDTNLAMLAPDVIETDPQRDLRDTVFARAYLHKVKKILRDDTDRYEHFLKIMSNVNQAGESPTKLYRDLDKLLGSYPDLMLEFAGFLLPEQAIECECYAAFQEFSQARGFLRKLEIYLMKNPQHFQKVMKVFSRWYRKPGRKVRDLRNQVEPLLKGNRVLLDEFAKFFPCEPPPDSWMDDFEEVNWEEMGDDQKEDSVEEVELQDGEEILGTKHCTCVCHDTGDDNYRKKKKHCYRCCLTVIDGELVYRINKSTIKKIQVSFGPPIKPGHVPCDETLDTLTGAEIKVEPGLDEEPVEVTNESDWLLDTEGAEKENIEHYSEGSNHSEESRSKSSRSGPKKGDKYAFKNSGFLQRISKLSRPTKKPSRLSTMLKSPRERTPSDLCSSESRDKFDCSDIKDGDLSSSEMIDDKDTDISTESGMKRRDADVNVTPSDGDVSVYLTADDASEANAMNRTKESSVVHSDDNVSGYRTADEAAEGSHVDQTEKPSGVHVTTVASRSVPTKIVEQKSPNTLQRRTSMSPDMEHSQIGTSQCRRVNMLSSSDNSSAVQHSGSSGDKAVRHSADTCNVSTGTESSESSISSEILQQPFGTVVLQENSTDSSSVSSAPLSPIQCSDKNVSEKGKTNDKSEKRTFENSGKFTLDPLIPKPCVADKQIDDISAPEGQSFLPVSSGSCFFKIDKAAAATSPAMTSGEVDSAVMFGKKKDDKADINVVSPFSPFGQEIQTITACQSPLTTVTSPGVCDQGKPVVKTVRRITPIPVKEQSLTSFQTLMENSPMLSDEMVQGSPAAIERRSSGEGVVSTSGVVKSGEPSRTPTPVSGDASVGAISISTKPVETSSISQNSGETLKSGSNNSDSNTFHGITITQPDLFSENANESFSKTPQKGTFLSEDSLFKCFDKPPEFGDHLASVSNLTNILDGLGGKLDNSKSGDENCQPSHDKGEHKHSSDNLHENKQNEGRPFILQKEADDETKINLLKEQSGDHTETSGKHEPGSFTVSEVANLVPICQTSSTINANQTTDECSSICLFTPLRKVLDNGTVILTSGNISNTDVSIGSEVSRSDSQKVVETKLCQESDGRVAGTAVKTTDEAGSKEESHSCKKRKKSKSRHKHSKKARHSKDAIACSSDVSKQCGSGMESDASSRKSRHKSKHKSKRKKHSKELARISGKTDLKQNLTIERLGSSIEEDELSDLYSDVVSGSIESGEVSRQSFSSQTDATEEEIQHINMKDGLDIPVKHELMDEGDRIISKSILNEGEKEACCKLKPRELNLEKSTVKVGVDVSVETAMECAIGRVGLSEAEPGPTADIKMEPNDGLNDDESQQRPSGELSSEILSVIEESYEKPCSKRNKKSKHKGKADDERKKRKKQKREKDKNKGSTDDKAECNKNVDDEEIDRRKVVESPVRASDVDLQNDQDGNIEQAPAAVVVGPSAADPGPAAADRGQAVVAEARSGPGSTSPQPQHILECAAGQQMDLDSSTEDSSIKSGKEDQPQWSKETDRIVLEMVKTMGEKSKTFRLIAEQLGHVTSKQVRRRFKELMQLIFGSSATDPD